MADMLTLFMASLLLVISSSPLLPSSSALCHSDDRKTLLAFMDAFGPPAKFPAWTIEDECCDWPGVVCNDTTGRIYSLDISEDDKLYGPIPPVVADLTTLQVLRFHKVPNLSGPIPRRITRLTSLRFLTVSWTNISGNVPAFLSDLPALEQLDLSFNNLSGSIPAGLSSAALYSVDLSRNRLTGPIPPSLLEKSNNSYIDLSHNRLTGSIPRSFADVAFIRIDLSRNSLAGDASFLLGRSKVVQSVVLSRNRLAFDLTAVELPEGDRLYDMDLSHNMIYGGIPKGIVKLGFLQLFNVSYNRLCGEIPGGGRMGDFDRFCFLHNKCLCGAPLQACN